MYVVLSQQDTYMFLSNRTQYPAFDRPEHNLDMQKIAFGITTAIEISEKGRVRTLNRKSHLILRGKAKVKASEDREKGYKKKGGKEKKEGREKQFSCTEQTTLNFN